MTKRFRLSFLLIVFALLLFLVACGEIEVVDTEFTVSFDLNNTAATGKPDNQTVTEGDYATEPTDPELEGYVFIGWYKEKATINEFYFDQDITADIKLYAKWEKDTGGSNVSDELKYPAAFSRIVDYIGEITTLSTDGITNYDEKNGTMLILSYVSNSLEMSFQLLPFAFTASFGTTDLTDAQIKYSFELLGFTNVEYNSVGNKYTLKYSDDNEGEVVSYAIVVEYDPATDSGIMKYYEGSATGTPLIYLEFVKTNDGYAIQSTYGKFVFKVVNKHVVSFTVSFFDNTTPLASIFKKPSLINSTWIVNNNEASFSFDGTKYKYLERETSLDYGDEVYRINVHEFQSDGTLIKKTIGQWVGLE